MTRICYDRVGLRMKIQGHAGAGEFGHDIVCAAESILMLVLERRLQEIDGENAVSVVKRPGAAEISCCPERGYSLRCTDVFEAVFLGYQLLESMYPEYVKTEILK
jgi:uncharacterized protein YsxB (DUF464 family)